MNRLAALLLLAGNLIGCGYAVPVFFIDARPASSLEPGELPFDRIKKACEFWDLDCYDADSDRGAVTILLIDHQGWVGERDLWIQGQSHDSACDPFLFAADDHDVPVVEHELGHIFELDHVDNPENVMCEHTLWESMDATDDQRDTVLFQADLLGSCPGR